MNFNFNPVNKNNAPAEQTPSHNNDAGMAKVTIRVDADCFLLCDGEFMEDIEIVANKITKVQLPIGQHLLEFMDMENPDIKVERAVDFPEEGKSYLVLVDGLEEAIAEAKEKKSIIEAERKATAEAERKAQEEAEREAKAEADRKAKAEAERKAKAEAERKAREEAERKAREEAERKAKALAEAKARKDITYTVTIGDVANMLKATMTARALFKWSTAEAKEKFADVPFDVLTTKSQKEATEILQKLNGGGIVAEILAVNALDEIVDIKELTAVAIAAAPVQQQLKQKKKTDFDVILKSAGASKLAVVKLVKELTGLGLKEAKDLVDGAPSTVKEALPKAEAEGLKKQLEEAGAEVELK